MDDTLDELGETHRGGAAGRGDRPSTSRFGELTAHASTPTTSSRCMTFLRDDPRCQFVSFIDICGVD